MNKCLLFLSGDPMLLLKNTAIPFRSPPTIGQGNWQLELSLWCMFKSKSVRGLDIPPIVGLGNPLT